MSHTGCDVSPIKLAYRVQIDIFNPFIKHVEFIK